MSDILDENAPDDAQEDAEESNAGGALSSWVMERVNKWREHRDSNLVSKWDEYYRIWRGQLADQDKTRKTERSRMVSPATMQAVDSTVAEIEEAVFGREQWIDIDEDLDEIKDEQQRDAMLRMRDLLLERMERDRVPTASSQSFLIGAIYGTAVGKINTDVRKVKKLTPKREELDSEEVYCELIPLEPYEFVPDPTTDVIDDMLGMAHETIVPLHKIREGQRDGKYAEDASVEAWDGEAPGDTKNTDVGKLPGGDGVFLTEYHGLVPAKYLIPYLIATGQMEKDPILLDAIAGMEPEDSLIEAIITIANKGELIRAQKNPFYFSDRCFISYQHDVVPKYFWGRGVPEKGYNAQKGLDTELRARHDALALVAHPMVAGDVTRLPRGMNLSVWPGKFWPTTGAPNEVLQPFTFGQLNPATFTNAGDMERMVQMATGAMDPGGQYNANQQSASNTAMNASAFIKRARRTMQNIERNWLRPLVRKMMLRYMQFDPQNFPLDVNYTVRGTLGIMAREFEQQQLIQMLSIVPNQSAPFLVLLKSIFNNSSSPHKAEMVKSVDTLLKPPDEETQKKMQMKEQLALRAQLAAVAEAEAKAQKAQGEANRANAQAKKFMVEADQADEQLADEQIKNAIDLREVQAFEMQNQISQMMTTLRSFELAIKAMEAKAKIETAKANAAKIRAT